MDNKIIAQAEEDVKDIYSHIRTTFGFADNNTIAAILTVAVLIRFEQIVKPHN